MPSKFLTELINGYYYSRLRTIDKRPEHIAIIMDGNGRWAKKRGLPRTEGHRRATRAIRDVVEASIQAGIPHLSLFAFSIENWKRPEEEVDAILRLIDEQVKINLDELNSNGVRIRLVGKKSELPDFLIKSFTTAEEATAGNSKLNLYLMINYSGQQEILDAVSAIIKTGPEKPIDTELFRQFLYVPEAPFPDLIIRTSGEKRISNFYLWQAAYSELYFDDVLWPDFQKYHLFRAIIDFSSRKRRFGGLREF